MSEQLKESRRVKYTKKIIRESFFTLLSQYPINKISVKMISEQANINRGTFYAYYKSPQDLLEKTENRLYDKVKENFKHYKYNVHPRQAIVHVFLYMKSEIEMCRVLFGENGDSEYLKRMLYIIHDEVIRAWKELYPQQSITMLEMVFNYNASGCAAVIKDWVFDDAGIDAHQLTDLLLGIWDRGLNSLKPYDSISFFSK